MTEKPQIELVGLSKTFQHRGKMLNVIRDLNLKIFAGDTISIMGPSGAGKSTFLHVLGTLDEPTTGSVKFHGEDIFRRTQSGLAKFRNEHIGFAFQFHHLLPEFTALENVMMPGLIGRKPKAEVQKRAEELLEMVGLKERFNHQPGELSGGEQQRVAIARALFMEPELLLTDEPTGNLDRNTGAEIHALLKRLNEQTGVSVVVVTHDPRLADAMAVRLLVEDGKLVPMNPEEGDLGGRLPERS